MDIKKKNKKQKRKITNFQFYIDSTGDSGTLANKKIAGLVSMNAVSGLKKISDNGRFTNGANWRDYFIMRCLNDLFIKECHEKNMKSDDIGDAALCRDKKNTKGFQYTINDPLGAHKSGEYYIETYAEGGMSAQNYAGKFTFNLKVAFSRLLLSTLDEKRASSLKDDTMQNVSLEQKRKTCIVDWTGANDIITKDKPNFPGAANAVLARIHNVRELIKQGYQTFYLFNLPDLSKLPRYKNMCTEDKKLLKEVCAAFNTDLNEQVSALKEEIKENYPNCMIKVFDIAAQYEDLYKNPKKYFFSESTRDQCYTEAPDFTKEPGKTSSAPNFISFDGLHCTTKAYYFITDILIEEMKKDIQILAPEAETPQALCNLFQKLYENTLQHDREKYGIFIKSNLLYNKKHPLTLDIIFTHAFDNTKGRTYKLLRALKWVNKYGEINGDIPGLAEIKLEMEIRQGKVNKIGTAKEI